MEQTALKIQGREGRHAKQINNTFELSPSIHNGKPYWEARSVSMVYLFHTGKNRWVIAKCLDDGCHCWAYREGRGDDPSTEAGPWVCHGEGCHGEGVEFEADPNVSCAAIPARNDKFVKLRMSIDAELEKYGLLDKSSLKSMWRRLDYNGNNIVSLAEIDKMVVEMVAGGTWPEWLNNKYALMRAYKKTILKDGDGDDWVEKKEFHALLLNIFWFNKLWLIFEEIGGGDRRIDCREMCAGMSKLGLSFTGAEAEAEFNKIDTNHGGQVLFVEFCAYVRKRVNPDANPAFDGDIFSGVNCGKTMRKQGHKATHTHYITKKCFKDFDDLEAKIKGIIKDKKKLLDLWHRIDFNGNNIVSLAEIDKLAVEAFPLLNHKPALMRAYKRTIKAETSDGDDWVDKKEFKMLLANLFYFNKIFWVFDKVDADRDRRMTYDEFKKVVTLCGGKMSEAEMRRDFQMVDKNGGGIILFDEFCQYFTSKSCPEGMSALVE